MKKYLGLSDMEENLIVYGNLVNRILDITTLVSVTVLLGYCNWKGEVSAIKTLADLYTKRANVFNYAVLSGFAFKTMWWIVEAYYSTKVASDLSRKERFENVK